MHSIISASSAGIERATAACEACHLTLSSLIKIIIKEMKIRKNLTCRKFTCQLICNIRKIKCELNILKWLSLSWRLHDWRHTVMLKSCILYYIFTEIFNNLLLICSSVKSLRFVAQQLRHAFQYTTISDDKEKFIVFNWTTEVRLQI